MFEMLERAVGRRDKDEDEDADALCRLEKNRGVLSCSSAASSCPDAYTIPRVSNTPTTSLSMD